MTKEQVMNSPKQNDQVTQDKSEPEAKAAAESRPDDENQAAIEDFDDEGMGVAPKE